MNREYEKWNFEWDIDKLEKFSSLIMTQQGWSLTSYDVDLILATLEHILLVVSWLS